MQPRSHHDASTCADDLVDRRRRTRSRRRRRRSPGCRRTRARAPRRRDRSRPRAPARVPVATMRPSPITIHAGVADVPPSPLRIRAATRRGHPWRSFGQRDAQLHQAAQCTGDAPSDRRARGAQLRRRPPGSPPCASPARSTRRISSVSKRSWPKRQRAATGSTAARRIAFMPCVSETCRPKPTRSIVLRTSRSRSLRSAVPRDRRRLRRASSRRRSPGRSASRTAVDRGVEEVEVEEVGVEVDDDLAAAPSSSPCAQRVAVVGVGAVLDAHFGVPTASESAIARRAVGRAVLDDDDLERLAALAQPVDAARSPTSRGSRPR